LIFAYTHDLSSDNMNNCPLFCGIGLIILSYHTLHNTD
jgi:hypothetical protein